MTRLINNINESVRTATFMVFMTNILKDCQPFIKYLTNQSDIKFLYSGRKRDTDWFKSTIWTDRKPRDIFIDIHKDFDKEFQKQFGWPARSNSLFCTGNQNEADAYGVSYMLFPIGNYKFLWSPIVHDLFMYLNSHAKHQGMKSHNGLWDFIHDAMEWRENANPTGRDIEKATKDEYDAFINNTVDSYESGGLYRAINSDNEIMLNCNGYYVVRYHDWKDLMFVFFKEYKHKPIKVDELEEWINNEIG